MAEDERIKSAIRAFMACRPVDRVACQDFGMQQEDLLQQQLEAAVEAYLAGDAVVPREPTPEMLFYISSIARFDASRPKSGNERAAYDAMLAAAPTPQRDRG